MRQADAAPNGGYLVEAALKAADRDGRLKRPLHREALRGAS